MKARLAQELGRYSSIWITKDGREELMVLPLAKGAYERCQGALDALDRAVAAVEAARNAWEARAPLDLPDQDMADFIRVWTSRAWETTNGPKGKGPPRSVHESDPLCRFITAALELIGQHRSVATVSAALRGLRRLRRA